MQGSKRFTTGVWFLIGGGIRACCVAMRGGGRQQIEFPLPVERVETTALGAPVASIDPPNVPTSVTGNATASATWTWEWNGPITCPAPGCTFDWSITGSGWIETNGYVQYNNQGVGGGSGKAACSGNAAGSGSTAGAGGSASCVNVGGSVSLGQMGVLNGNVTYQTNPESFSGVTATGDGGVDNGSFYDDASWSITLKSTDVGRGSVAKGVNSFTATATATINGTVNCSAKGVQNLADNTNNTVVGAYSLVNGQGQITFSIGTIYLN